MLSVVVVASLGLAACGGDEAGTSGEDPIVLGAILSLTGGGASYGEMARGGIDIAVNEINDAGGIDGRPVEVKYEDNQLQPANAALAAQKLTGDGVRIIFSHGSSLTAAVTEVTDGQDALVANIAAQSDVVVAHPQVYSFIPTNSMELGHLSGLAYDKRGARTMAILHSDDDYGDSASAAVTESFEALGGEVVANESHPPGTTDMRTQLLKIRDTSPDALVVLSNTGEIGHIVKQAREMRIEADIMGADTALAPSEAETAGEAYNGMIGVAIRFDKETNPEAKAFAETFQAEYGMEPNNYAAIAYEAMRLLAVAMEENGDDPETVGEALLEVQDVEGILGPMTFNSERIVEFPYYEWEFDNGVKPLS